MAVVSVKECTLLKATNKIENDSPTAQRQFIVILDAAPIDLDAVTIATDGTTAIPAIGAAYKSGDFRTLKSKSVSSLGTVLDYLVTCDFAVTSNSFEPNPLSRPDEIKGSGTSRDRAYFKDFSDDEPQQVVTSAGEPFDHLPENTVGEWSITITGNRANIDLPTWAEYLAPDAVAINDSAFSILGINIGAGQAKLKNIRFGRKTEGSYKYWEVEWEIALAPTYDQDIDDRGFFQLNNAADGIVPIMADDGITPVAKPAPLGGTGYYDPDVLSGGPQAYLTFKPQPARDFSIFNWTATA